MTKEQAIKVTPMMPTVRLTEKELPDIKGWSVGKKYRVMIEMEQMSMSRGDEYNDSEPKTIEARFKIHSVKSMMEYKKENMGTHTEKMDTIKGKIEKE